MFGLLKLFPQDNAVTGTMKAALRWGAGVVITALGFQGIYAVLDSELALL